MMTGSPTRTLGGLVELHEDGNCIINAFSHRHIIGPGFWIDDNIHIIPREQETVDMGSFSEELSRAKKNGVAMRKTLAPHGSCAAGQQHVKEGLEL